MKAKHKAIAYYRVSTSRQGALGLGLAAQRRTVEAFCASHGFHLTTSFKDVESGKESARPGLLSALAKAKAEDATVIIAKLDRLSRDVGFLFKLRNEGAHFIAADLPEANTMTVGIMASMAQYERELISSRTKAALDAKRTREPGWKPGTNNLTSEGRTKSAMVRRQKAMDFNSGTILDATAFQKEGWSMNRIAQHLNARGSKTRRGNAWSAKQVTRILAMGRKGSL